MRPKGGPSKWKRAAGTRWQRAARGAAHDQRSGRKRLTWNSIKAIQSAPMSRQEESGIGAAGPQGQEGSGSHFRASRRRDSQQGVEEDTRAALQRKGKKDVSLL